MLDGDCAFRGIDPEGVTIYWGANLGMPEEILIAGPLAEVRDRIVATRAEARAAQGWIMDTYVLRREREPDDGGEPTGAGAAGVVTRRPPRPTWRTGCPDCEPTVLPITPRPRRSRAPADGPARGSASPRAGPGPARRPAHYTTVAGRVQRWSPGTLHSRSKRAPWPARPRPDEPRHCLGRAVRRSARARRRRGVRQSRPAPNPGVAAPRTRNASALGGRTHPDFVDGRNPGLHRSARPAAGRWAGPFAIRDA